MRLIKKIKNKYLRLSQMAKVSLWYTFSNFMQKILVVISVPIITRMITSSEYGMYSVYNSWFEIIYNICTLALASGGYFVGMKSHAENKRQYDSAVCSLCISITIFVFAIFTVMPRIWKIILTLPLSYQLPMFVGISSGCPRDFWAASERYELKYKKLVLVTLLTSAGVLVSQVISILIAKANEQGKVLSVIWGGVIPSVIAGIPILLSILLKGRKYFDKDIWKETFTFNVVLIPYYMSITFLNQIDRIMIERFVDAEHVGYYSVAYRAASTINILTIALNQSLMPWIFQKLKDNREYEVKRISTFILIIPFSISLIMVLLAPEIIIVLSGKDYLEAACIIPSVAIGMCLRFVSQIFIDVEMYYEKNKIITNSTIAIAILNFVLNWIFIPKYGFLSAGYTTLICFLAQALVHSFIVSKCTQNNRIFNFKLIWTFISVIIVVGLIFALIYENMLARYSLIFIFVVVSFEQRNKIIPIIKELRSRKE